ncbi:MAG TPA: glucoamylase family protein [Gemmatimonadaceae bacterium]|nr:glucoamylase family protein [Gemmatimonadaceae bacterium]
MRARHRCTACRGRTGWFSSPRGGGSAPRSRSRLAGTLARTAAAALALLLSVGCGSGDTPPPTDGGNNGGNTQTDAEFLSEVEERTFRWFWETTNPANGLVPDRWPTPSFSSTAAVGFGLTSYVVGAERGWVTRAEARDRTLATLRFLWTAPQGAATSEVTGYRGFFYHFLDMSTGRRFGQTELSTIDTGLLMMGVLAAGQYFSGADAAEAEVRTLAESLYRRVEWDWAVARPPAISMGWQPGTGFLPYDYDGYNEAMLLYLLALGSPTHPVAPEAWTEYTSSYRWVEFQGQPHVNFGPLFGHQYSHAWVDFRGIRDEYMRARGIDYFENSRRATLAQQSYAIQNPNGWQGYSAKIWGLTASDGPGDFSAIVGSRNREFHAYWARAAAAGEIRDDGTIAPTAVGGSIPFAPEITIPALRAMRDGTGGNLYAKYGFKDAFNLSITQPGLATRGTTVPGVGWFNTDYLGIDQGPIVLMIENHRSGLVWGLMRENPHLVRGLCRAGFTGGWIEGKCV